MSKGKTLISSVVDNSTTKHVKAILAESQAADWCFTEFNQLTLKHKGLFSSKIASADQDLFTTWLRRQQEHEPFSSELDWLSPRTYNKYVLMNQQPMPQDEGLYLVLERQVRPHALTYHISTPSGMNQTGELILKGCDLRTSTLSAVDIRKGDSHGQFSKLIKTITPVLGGQDAVIKSSDGKFFYVDRKSKRVEPIAKAPETAVDFEVLQTAFNTNEETAEPHVRQSITALTGHTFPIDDVANSLSDSAPSNILDSRLSSVFEQIAEQNRLPTALNQKRTYAPENFNRSATPDDKEFFNEILGAGTSGDDVDITPYLSQSEILRYHLAFLAAISGQQEPVLEKTKTAFKREMQTQLLNDAYDDLKTKLREMEQTGVKETVLLVKKLMKQIKSSNTIVVTEKINELRELHEFMDTSWAKGTAITKYAETRDLRDPTLLAQKQVVEPKPLPIDKATMPDYQKYQHIFGRYPTEMANYNFKIELKRTRDSLETKLYAPENHEQFQQIKSNCKNCFIFYNNKMHHINSDGTCRSLKSECTAQAFNEAELRINGVTFNHRTRNSNEYDYSEINMKKLLGDTLPIDPNLELAHKMMNQVVTGTTIKDYLMALRKQAPKFGKVMSTLTNLRDEKKRTESIGKFWLASEKAATTRRAMMNDKFSAPSEESIEALRTVRRMSESELIINSSAKKKECSLALWSKPPTDKMPVLQGKGTNQYILVTIGEKHELYFVDRTDNVPVIKQLFENKENRFFHKLSDILDGYANVAVTPPNDDYNYGRDLSTGCHARFMQTLPQDTTKLAKSIEESKEVLIVNVPPDKFRMIYWQNNKISKYHVTQQNNNKLWEILNQYKNKKETSAHIINPDHINALNATLAELNCSTQIGAVTRVIPNIPPDLDADITENTRKLMSLSGGMGIKDNAHIGLKPTVYDEHFEAYRLNAVSNRLTSVLVQRRALSDAYFESMKPVYQKIRAKGYRILEGGKEPDYTNNPKQVFVSINHVSGEYTTYWMDDQGVPQDYEFRSKAALWGDPAHHFDLVADPPTLEALHEQLESERYRSKRIPENQYEQLKYWKDHRDKPPPFPLENGVLYFAYDAKLQKFVCFAMNPQGELAFTPANIEENKVWGETDYLPNDVIVRNLLPHAREYGLTPKAALVAPGFLDRCEEAQRFLHEIGDQGVLPGSLISTERREKMLSMMAVCANDPTSKEATHYLRDSHKLFFIDAAPGKPFGFPVGADESSFFLDYSTHPEKPTLYRYVGVDQDNNPVLDPVNLKSPWPLTDSPEVKLLKLGNAAMQSKHSRDVQNGDSMDLSCNKVFNLITSQQEVASGQKPFKTNTAQEMLEEIIAEELSWKKAAYNVLTGLCLGLLGVLMIPGLVTIPGGISALLWAGGLIMAGIQITVLGCIASACFQEAVVKTTWNNPKMFVLKDKLAQLKSLQIDLEVNQTVVPETQVPVDLERGPEEGGLPTL
ncbi:MAG: hypothetical protein Q8R24_09020 [Legionellaceae bacterium]|nr:hypothetical protein [Legionellaceae bacterium]